ncbi:5-bromo-4-chloroindolyl phosphate hydrolysis family protein [Vagococcus sp. PNs007]|uniref:5-bromo-4-chloroindolyl phosphate hydrolysis family protein n=2 Tax=Vagococcus proximus TaxID=2991417 RepID=A0ABT5X279_9ENTE|nr:5-bromo-4-chloroindolyl phosphate hydrolysis family protein [Vagococcus proximus]
MSLKTRKQKNKRFFYILMTLTIISLLFVNGDFMTLLMIAWLIYLIRFLKGRRKKTTKSIPSLTEEKSQHYYDNGMTDQQIDFFRETMAHTKKLIVQLEENMAATSKLRAIDLRNDTVKAAKGTFKELVKEPRKLHKADQFLYTHLPNLVDLTGKYLEIDGHDLKNKATYQALEKSAAVIDDVSLLLVADYQAIVADDLEELDIEIAIAKQNMAREKELASFDSDTEKEQEN